MQVSFPELTELRLSSDGETPPVASDSFLGGSAPHLRVFQLSGIPFPGLPKLLLSATHLLRLELSNIPHSGYFSPEAMAALLSVLSSLKTLFLRFQSPRSRPDWERRRPPPPKRFVVPTLKHFHFKGVIEYLEDLVTFIDAPQLNALRITVFNQIDFDCPRLAQFISRTPIFRDRNARVEFDDSTASVRLPSPLGDSGIEISCREPDWQLSSVEQVCNSCLPPLSMIEDLYIKHRYSKLVWKNDAIENTLWVELLLPFTGVKKLHLSRDFAPGIAAALKEIVGTEVLPSLQNISVDGSEPSGPFRENIGRFIAAREHSGHSITISVWGTSICPECRVAFRRVQDRNRHIESHLPHSIHCPFDGCVWTGRRQSDFKGHWGKTHPGNAQVPGEGANQLYDPKAFVKSIIDGTPIEKVARAAFSKIQERLTELGREEIGVGNVWGRNKALRGWIST